MKKLLFAVLSLTLLAASLLTYAQSPLSRVAGRFIAANYNYRPIAISVGTTATGSATITLGSCVTTLPDGTAFSPFVTGTLSPIIAGVGTPNAETVTPTAVSNTAGVCTITATFANVHGSNESVVSGSFGLNEAFLDASGQVGIVNVSSTAITDAMIGALLVDKDVQIEDTRTFPLRYWTIQPTGLTAVATPATRSAAAGTTQVIDSATVGTFANSAYYFCVTYVDILGNESPCSASFTYTPAGSLAVFWNTPAASAGAVGWIPYAGLTGTSTQYRIVPTASICTLSTVEVVVPACAIGSNATTLGPVTTSALAPGYTVAVYRPNHVTHTTFAYQPTYNTNPGPILADSGPFLATAGGTTTQKQVIGSVNLPAGYLNYIGRRLKVTGKITGTFGTSETPQVLVQLGPTFTTGTPTNICTFTETTALSAAVYNIEFSCTMLTTATGATGAIMPGGSMNVQIGAGTTTGPVAVESGVSAITCNVLAQDVLYVTYIGTSGTSSAVQLLSLHLESN